MQKMLDTVKTTEAKKLLHEILRQNRPRQLSTTAEKDAAIQLAASGAIVVDGDVATISAPLIQQVLMYSILIFLKCSLCLTTDRYCSGEGIGGVCKYPNC